MASRTEPSRAPEDAAAPTSSGVPVVVDEPLSDEKVSQLIEQFESEAPTRALDGPWRWVAGILAAALSLYALYWTQYSITTQIYRATFLMVALVLTFLLYPLRGRRSWIEFAAITLLGAA